VFKEWDGALSEILRLSKGDYGINITYTIRDENGAARDISAATSIKLRIGRYGETNSIIEGTMVFTNDGKDGLVSYTILQTDLLTSGYYDAEILLMEANSKLTAKMFTIQIVDILNTKAS
jgi:hypothetical protein